MTNIKNNSLFNEELKEKFLNTVNEDTRPSYRRIFKKTAKHERALNKDINSFDLEEIETVLRSFKAKSRNTVESYGRIISSYLNWCVKENKVIQNVMMHLKPDDFSKYISDDINYMSEKELARIEDLCENYQDAVILRLLFIGVGGRQLSEIRNLTKDDVDFENKKLRLINALKEDGDGKPIKFTERLIDVDDRTLNLIRGAMNQKTYMKRNGEVAQTENDNIRPYTDLINNKYVIRASITKTDTFSVPVDKFVIYRRLSMLEEVLGLNKFNAKLIQQSGMLYLASKLTNNQDDIQLYDLKIVADHFNINSYHNLKGVITVDNIKRLYPRNVRS